MSSRNKHNLDIERILPLLIEGWSFRKIAEFFNCPLSTLYDYCSKNSSTDGIDANSPRARIKDALMISADSYADKAEQVLLDAENKSSSEVHRANYLSCHYRWLSSKRNPHIYGNQENVEVNQTTRIVKVKSKSNSDTE